MHKELQIEEIVIDDSTSEEDRIEIERRTLIELLKGSYDYDDSYKKFLTVMLSCDKV